jgi:hypothetical protein
MVPGAQLHPFCSISLTQTQSSDVPKCIVELGVLFENVCGSLFWRQALKAGADAQPIVHDSELQNLSHCNSATLGVQL